MRRRDLGKLAVAVGGGLVAGFPAAARAAAAAAWRVTGTSVPALASFDSTMKDFMRARGVSAGQLAVTYQGRLVLARGYTNSDDASLTVEPTSLFRVASLSKSVTAAAVARLAQDGKLSLGTPVTSLLPLTAPDGQTADPRLSAVTLWRLLQHTGGWDRAITPDPMFQDRTISRALGVPMEINGDHIARYATGKALDFDPGSRFAYSNYGYLLAGQVIERVSGMPYASYVRQHLLGPIGITRMKLGWSIAPHAGEVPYRSQYTGTTVLNESGATVAAPYGAFSMGNQWGNGRWVASAVDMVRWARLFDGASAVLDSTTLSRVFAQPEVGLSNGWYYGLGWNVRPVAGGTGRNTWHTGSLPGNYSLLVRTHHGMSWAALFNQRDDPSGLSYADIDPALWTASRAVTNWPTHDLFPNYF
ncbi:serine hydrolase domain-containing protein [Micromonospora sp. CPCC 206061]|uniref:serine hydrolase domain-containing protein n=1 Tax=Micromonospora sp. CPCC 206061 TaxID=3122410 RepID=UPI002FF28017